MKSWKWFAALVAVILSAVVLLQGLGVLTVGDGVIMLAIAVLALGLTHLIP